MESGLNVRFFRTVLLLVGVRDVLDRFKHQKLTPIHHFADAKLVIFTNVLETKEHSMYIVYNHRIY